MRLGTLPVHSHEKGHVEVWGMIIEGKYGIVSQSPYDFVLGVSFLARAPLVLS